MIIIIVLCVGAGRALEAIRGGMSVQRAATQFGIPSGTLYGRCKREGIELVHKVLYFFFLFFFFPYCQCVCVCK